MASETVAKPPAAKRRGLVDFARDERREQLKRECPVCRLPDDVMTEIKAARSKGILRDVVLRWIKTEVKITITPEAMDTHTRGNHETR